MTPPRPAPGPDAPTGKRAAFPLGAKVACFIIGLVVLLVGGFGIVSASRSAALLAAEIDQRGAEIARVLAEGMPRATHTEFGRTWSVMFENPPVEDATGEWKFRRQQERKAWLGTFQQLRQSGDLLNVVVTEGGSPTLFTDPPETFDFRPDPGSGETVHSGVCRRGAETVAVRVFRQPIFSGDRSKTFGNVEIYMSLAAADRARRKAMFSTALLGGGAAVVGAILSIFVGGMVSRPVRTLTRDMAIVRTGNFEHRTAVATADEIGLLAAAFNEMTAGLQDSERMRNDLRLAQDIQAKLLPAKLPKVPGFDLAARYRPATEVSGDYYDVFLLPDGRFGIAVGDVSGKGVAAGLIMTMTRALIRMGALGGLPPKKLLSRVNSVLFQDLKRGAFVTLLYAIVDPREGLVRFASAGHNPLCVWDPRKRECADVEAPGIALGVAAPALFDARTEEVTHVLPPDGRLLIYTDGVTEAMSKVHEQFGDDRMRAAIQASSGESSERLLIRLLESIEQHRKEAPPWDDITVVAVRRLPEAAPKPAAPASPEVLSRPEGGERPEDETSILTDTSRRIASMRGDLMIKVEVKPDNAGVIRINGSVDAHTFSDLEHAFAKLNSLGAVWIVVDLSAMTYISSVGLNYLVNRRVHLVQNDGDVTLVAPQPAIAKIFKMLGLDDVLHVTATEEEVWAARNSRREPKVSE